MPRQDALVDPTLVQVLPAVVGRAVRGAGPAPLPAQWRGRTYAKWYCRAVCMAKVLCLLPRSYVCVCEPPLEGGADEGRGKLAASKNVLK